MKKVLFLAAWLFASWLQAFAEDAGRSAFRWEADGRLHRGDLSPIDAAFQRRDLPDLWYFFGMAASYQYGYGRTVAEEQELKNTFTESAMKVMNSKIRAHAGSLLAQIPGHAAYLGDPIEAASAAPPGADPKNEHLRLHNMLALGRLGSPEAIQQIGRFLEDKRNPRAPLHTSADAAPPMPNWFNAAYAMDEALGKRSPLEGKRPNSGILQDAHFKELQGWWRSEAGLSFRQPLPGLPLSSAPAPPVAESTVHLTQTAPALWVLIAGLSGILLAVLYYALQGWSRKRNASRSKE